MQFYVQFIPKKLSEALYGYSGLIIGYNAK